jgi:ribosomal protein S18 acetylase RimI-like enzyme
MIIREAKKRDVNAVAKLDKQFWDMHKKLDPLIVPKKINHIQNAKQVIRRRGNLYYVAEIDYNIIGAINFEIMKNDPFFKVKNYGYIHAIVVDKNNKVKGVAKKLTKFALEFLKEKGIKYVRSDVYLKNIIARKTLKSFGFKDKSVNLLKAL